MFVSAFWYSRIVICQERNPSGVNFINIKRTNYSYERHFGSFSIVTCTKKKLPKQRLYKKIARITLMKLTPGIWKDIYISLCVILKVLIHWFGNKNHSFPYWQRPMELFLGQNFSPFISFIMTQNQDRRSMM